MTRVWRTIAAVADEQLAATASLQRWAGVAAGPQARSGPTYIPELDDYNPGLDRSLPF